MISSEKYKELSDLVESIMDENGHEVPNPRPMEIPTGFKRPSTLRDQIRRILRTEISLKAMEHEMESFDEANDFDVTDDFETLEQDTRYTVVEEEIPQETQSQTPPDSGPHGINPGSEGVSGETNEIETEKQDTPS